MSLAEGIGSGRLSREVVCTWVCCNSGVVWVHSCGGTPVGDTGLLQPGNMRVNHSAIGSADFTVSLGPDLSFNPRSHNNLSPLLDSSISKDQGTQCEDPPYLEDATISYFPLFRNHKDHHKRSISVRKERKPVKSRETGTADGRRTGSFGGMKGEKGGSASGDKPSLSALDKLLAVTADRPITTAEKSPKKGFLEEKLTEVLNDYLPLRIGVDLQHKHFHLQSWRKESKDSPVRRYGSPLSLQSNPLNSPYYPPSYSRKRRVYFKPKPSKDLTEETREYIRQRKAFLNLKGRRQEITPSPHRQKSP